MTPSFVFDASKPLSLVTNDSLISFKTLIETIPAKTSRDTFGFILHKQSKAGKHLGIPFVRRTMQKEFILDQAILSFPDEHVSNILLSYFPSGKCKFSYMASVIKNPFVNDEQRTIFVSAFCKAQRIYHALSRFARIVKIRISPQRNCEDMFMNPISRTDKNVISILQHGQLYLFTVSDLKRIIDTALSNSPWFFTEPIPIKNPYNNIPFQKADLYNIYFFMKSRIIHMSPLFQQYFMSNFHLGCFKDENTVLIQTAYIKQYVKNMDTRVAYDTILKIFRTILCGRHKIVIDVDFPKERLVSIMRPYLMMYYFASFSFDVMLKQMYKHRLKKSLTEFYRYNPLFGRKYIDLSGRTVSFNDTHKRFRYENTLSKFATSHLVVEDYADDAEPVRERRDPSESDSDSVARNVHHNPVMEIQIVDVEMSVERDSGDEDEDNDSISDLDEENEEIYDP
jgi:hypothetical protein